MPSHYGDSDKLIDQQLLENIIRKQSMGPIGSTVNLSSPATTMKIPPAAPPPVMRGSGQTAISPKLTQALMNQGINPGPVTSKTQMFAKMGTAAIGGVLERMRTDDAQEVKSRIAQAISSIPGIPPEMVASVNALARHNPAAALKIIASERKNAAGEGKFTTEVINGIKYQRGPKGKLDLFPTAKDNRTTAQKNLEAMGLIPGSREYRAAMEKFIAKTGGTQLTINNAPTNTKGADTALDKKILSANEAVQRIHEIDSLFKPKFQDASYRVYIWKLGQRDKGLTSKLPGFMGGGELTESEGRDLDEFREFEIAAFDNMNRYIKEITGAQMSDGEAERILRGIPDPRSRFFIPAEGKRSFAASMRRTKTLLRGHLARMIFARKTSIVGSAEAVVVPTGRRNSKGNPVYRLRPGVLSVEQMNDRMNKRETQITAELKKKGLEGRNLDKALDARMKKEFFTPEPGAINIEPARGR